MGARKIAYSDHSHSTTYGTGDGDSGKGNAAGNATAGTFNDHIGVDPSDRVIDCARPIGKSGAESERTSLPRRWCVSLIAEELESRSAGGRCHGGAQSGDKRTTS